VTFISGFKRAKPLIKAVEIGLALLVVGVAIGCYLLSNTIFRELNSPRIVESGINTEALLNSIPALICALVFLLTMMTSFRVLLEALYLARDMDFLVAAPILYPGGLPESCWKLSCSNFIRGAGIRIAGLVSLGVEGGFHIVYYPLWCCIVLCIASALQDFAVC
jgi:hypothetical protein